MVCVTAFFGPHVQSALGRIVSDFIATGLAANLPGLIVATPEPVTLFESQLRARGVDVERLKAMII